MKIEDVLAIDNGVIGINNATDTRVKIVSQSFNNKLGILDVDYSLQNYFDQFGAFKSTISPVHTS